MLLRGVALCHILRLAIYSALDYGGIILSNVFKLGINSLIAIAGMPEWPNPFGRLDGIDSRHLSVECCLAVR
jgi:hypothetical protein